MAELQELLKKNLEIQNQLMQVLGRSTNNSTPHFEKYIEGEDIEDFLDKFETLVSLNNFTEEKKVAVLVTLLPSNIFSLLKNLLHPVTFQMSNIKNIRSLLIGHLKPKPLIIPSRHTFLNRRQKENESVSSYISALRNLAISCVYPEAQLKIMLRDVFVSGLADKVMLDRLFEEDDPDLDKVLQIALAIEKAQSSTQEILHYKGISTKPINEIKRTKNKDFQKANSDKSKFSTKDKNKLQCYRCAEYGHKAPECKKKNLQCTNCGKKGHLKKVCKSKEKVHQLDVNDVIPLNFVSDKQSEQPLLMTIRVEGKPVTMEVDTGSAKSVLNYTTFRRISNKKLVHTNVRFRTYNKSLLVPLGVAHVTVSHGEKKTTLPLYIVEQELSPILGREWIYPLSINWDHIYQVELKQKSHNVSTQLLTLLDEFKDIFAESSGKASNFTAKLTLKENAPPIFRKARPVPYALQPLVMKELDRLEGEGILEKIECSDYATPIVPVRKPDGNIRICADYSQTLNPQLQVPQYPVPRTEDLFANLSKGVVFSKLDIRTAYLSLPVDDYTANLLTLNTHKGLYKPRRLMFGINAAPAIWQKYIDTVLHSALQQDGVCIFFDDILLAASTEEHLLKKLKMVFHCLRKNGLHLNLSKCKFIEREVNYLGYVISKEGVKKSNSKVEAILKVHTPNNVKEIKSFLGMVTFYSKFFPQLSSTAAPLYELTKKDIKFKWTQKCEASFRRIKEEIASERVLIHYDSDKPVVLAVDAGPIGIGAVISHTLPDGTERPIAFTSRTLNSSERNYSQIDKEALAIKWGVEKFHFYLIGRRFTLITDHKPLIHIFGNKSKLPGLCATRLLHYALFLQNFEFDIRYRRSEEHGNADCLSRFPLISEELFSMDSIDLFQLDHMSRLPLSSKEIATATTKDPELKTILEQLRQGTSLGARDRNLSLQSGCIMNGLRVFIPKRFREALLEELHVGHLGIVKMKALARSYIYWPKIDEEIERMCRKCSECSQYKGLPPKYGTHYWEYPAKPWERIHMDYATYGNKTYLLIVDAHSKWPEIFIVPNMNSITLINILDSLFSRYGLPVTIVTDNQSTFIGENIHEFLADKGIRHLTSPPYHAASNGQAERHVFNLKQALRCLKIKNLTEQQALNIFLAAYRRAPHVTTGYSPAFLFLKREVRTRLDLARPNLVGEVNAKQRKQVTFLDHVYQTGQKVAVRSYRSPFKKWVFGTIVAQDGELQYTVAAQNQLWRRHSNQIRPISQEIPLTPPTFRASCPTEPVTSPEPVQEKSESITQHSYMPASTNHPRPTIDRCRPVNPTMEPPSSVTSEAEPSKMIPASAQHSANTPLAVARPRRNIRPPKRLNL